MRVPLPFAAAAAAVFSGVFGATNTTPLPFLGSACAHAEGPSPSTGATPVSLRRKEDLAAWTVSGDVSVTSDDPAHGAAPGKEQPRSERGMLRVGPGGSAIPKLREHDGAGKIDFRVYDDGTAPQNPKAAHVGPRWGLIQEDGKIVAPGILYAAYLGGAEGYTASISHGKDWFDELIWLGTNRAPAGWHKWTLDFSPEEGLKVLVDEKPVSANIDSVKLGLTGFKSFAVWGDSEGNGKGGDATKQQVIWLADLATTLGGEVNLPKRVEIDPYAPAAVEADLKAAGRHPIAIFTKTNAPAAPALESLPLKQSVSQYGITWTFDKPARVGQFVNGDWYVVGPVTVTGLNPQPLYGAQIPKWELDHMDRERPEEQRVRNGFMVNPPAESKVAYDSGIRNFFDPALLQKLPAALTPGDSLVATISMPKGLSLHAQLRNEIERGVEDSSPVRTAAALTCVSGPQPADAFRPAFCDRTARIYLARNLQRNLLRTATRTESAPKLDLFVRCTQRPWVGTGFFGFEEPVENMPQYGREYGRVSGLCALLLCTDFTPEEKEPLLINFVQVGIDLAGMVRGGHPGFPAFGGHGSGRKLPIVFAGLLLGDEGMAEINRSFPKTSFGEDEQTAYGQSWTGAKVAFTGHSGIDVVTGAGRNHEHGGVFGPYEHLPPTKWKTDQQTSESYRRCCTSVAWIAQALALRLMQAEKTWNHDAFFDYADRWMNEDDSATVQRIKEATGKDFSADFARQRQTWEPFVNEMWRAHRGDSAAPADGWKQPHDTRLYEEAIAKGGTAGK